ncbi:MAG TPA: exodeoxyribonuclease VII large subunit, partial [Firmicutes bacterium]|nr:exodeoxyribonuclease VII large subunit [Bacillota bacterium]
MNNHIFSVSELSKVIGEVLQGSLFQNITIRGEIQSCSTKGRYTYIGLIDEQKADDASLTIVVGPYCDILTPNYKVGDVILVRGNLNYYKARGSVSFWPRVLEIDGLGQELLRLERLKQKLASEGIFSLEHKRSLPRRVKTLAVVTSSSGAVINDIRATLKNRFPVKLNLYSANVQGKDASVTLTKALQNAINDAPDLIILARGGGSKADLAPFNDEALVRTVYSSPIPIISAVGHQVDTSLTDLAADKSAITPTEAATFVGMSLVDVIREREELKEKLVQVMKDRILALENRLENHIIELDSLSIQNKLTNI